MHRAYGTGCIICNYFYKLRGQKTNISHTTVFGSLKTSHFYSRIWKKEQMEFSQFEDMWLKLELQWNLNNDHVLKIIFGGYFGLSFWSIKPDLYFRQRNYTNTYFATMHRWCQWKTWGLSTFLASAMKVMKSSHIEDIDRISENRCSLIFDFVIQQMPIKNISTFHRRKNYF